MGLLSLFSKPTPTLLSLPSGSFTVDRHGRILVGTLPSSFPVDLTKAIGKEVLTVFHEALAAQLPLSEVTISYPSLKITARELRGGAIVYLTPKAASGPANPF